MAASAKACWVVTLMLQGALSWKGVERPAADKGLLGRIKKQSVTVALRMAAVCAAVVAVAVFDIIDCDTRVLLTRAASHCAASKNRTLKKIVEIYIVDKFKWVSKKDCEE